MKKKNAIELITKGFKVTNADFSCLKYKYEMDKVFTHSGDIKICSSGFHFCKIVNYCFNYYSFNSTNRVFEIEAYGELQTNGKKNCCNKIKFIRELTWLEVLTVVNSGNDNTGRSNSGDSNSGYRNSGDRNSGDSNSGDSNSGDSNSGYRNSGDRNSGDSNSGYRNSGAFCIDKNPYLILFDVLTDIKIKDWENMEVSQLMYGIDLTIWVPISIMTDKEKTDNPKYETIEGYLKTISMHEAWANFWGNLKDNKKSLFTSLPHFNAAKFKIITGIEIKP